MPGLQEILFHILCIAWLRDLQSETFDYLVLRRKDEYIFGFLQRVLTSAEVLIFFPRKLNPCFWRGKHDLIYYRKGIPVNTILLSPSAHSMADARHNVPCLAH